MNPSLPVAIIGGGLAGLTAASVLRQRQIPVVLFEAGPQLAGMAQSYADGNGFSYDFGAHFITNRLAAAVGVSNLCRDVRYYGESVYLNRSVYDYPFGLMRVPRFLVSGVAAKLTGSQSPASAADWFRQQFGRALADEVALPLLEAWSGAPAHELAPAVGGKLKNSIGYTLYLRLASRLQRRAISIGYSHEMPENPSVWHVYPEGGVATVCHKLAEPVSDSISLESRVERIYVDRDQVRGIRVNGRDRDVSAVISTAPANILAKIVSGTSALDGLRAFRYRPMVFVNLLLNGRGYLPDTVLWTPGPQFPFFRLTETMLSMPWLAPDGKTILTADIGCESGDTIWNTPDDQLAALCLDALEPIAPGVRRAFIGSRVLRTPIAYPVYLNAYEQRRQEFERGTGVQGLWSIGRNGEFAHILMEDIYWRTVRKMDDVAEYTRTSSESRIATAS